MLSDLENKIEEISQNMQSRSDVDEVQSEMDFINKVDPDAEYSTGDIRKRYE